MKMKLYQVQVNTQTEALKRIEPIYRNFVVLASSREEAMEKALADPRIRENMLDETRLTVFNALFCKQVAMLINISIDQAEAEIETEAEEIENVYVFSVKTYCHPLGSSFEDYVVIASSPEEAARKALSDRRIIEALWNAMRDEAYQAWQDGYKPEFNSRFTLYTLQFSDSNVAEMRATSETVYEPKEITVSNGNLEITLAPYSNEVSFRFKEV